MKHYVVLFTCLLLIFVVPATSVYSADSTLDEDYDKIYFKETLEKAKNGDAYSQFMLGYLYLQGLGVNKDVAGGLKIIVSAAEKNNFMAQLIVHSR
jgi:TPR repeat protein